MTTAQRHFLFLQGPHGPFFDVLSKSLRQAGHRTSAITFNAGDQAFWSSKDSYIQFKDLPEARTDFLADRISAYSDIVLYGDVREHHAQAIEQARELNLNIHVFEEGYLRPFWITYERGGVNGSSHLMQIKMSEISEVMAKVETPVDYLPSHWGQLRQHSWYGVLYHFYLFFGQARYPNYRPHRSNTLMQDFSAQLLRFIDMPRRFFTSKYRWAKLRNSSRPFSVALLQLGHDSSIQAHSKYDDMEGFIDEVIVAFAKHAPAHHQLLFKAHPLQQHSGRLQRYIACGAKLRDCEGRVHYLDGGKLSRVLARAKSVVTVNSTAAHQAFWRGLPVKSMGAAIYNKVGLASKQDLGAFFEAPEPPNRQSYAQFRAYLLASSQLRGGFYAKTGRAQLLRELVDLMLIESDQYDHARISVSEHKQESNIISFTKS